MTSNDDLTAKYAAKISDPFVVYSVKHVNFKPHPFMIGPKHISYAAKHCFGLIDERVMSEVPCAMTGCRLTYAEHVSDRILFLKLIRSCFNSEATKVIQPLAAEMQKDGIDGVAFVETPEKFRIEKDVTCTQPTSS